MQAREFPGHTYQHTSRYKPSKELIQLTQRKMKEVTNLVNSLQSRLNGAHSTAEKEAIQEKIENLTKQYNEYLQQCQDVRTESACSKRPQSAQSTDQQNSNRPDSQEAPEGPKQCPKTNSQQFRNKNVQLLEDNLKRREGKMPASKEPCPDNWTELTRQRRQELLTNDRAAEQQRHDVQLRYKEQLD